MVKVHDDMTGWIMSEHGVPSSRLTVIEQVEDYVDPRGVHASRWRCKCNCGSNKDVFAIGRNLKSGSVLSCGCKKKEASAKVWLDHIEDISEALRKPNKVDLSGEYGIGWTTNTNQEFYFDLEDYDKIKDYTWLEATRKSGYRYLIAHVPGTYSKTINILKVLGFVGYDHHNRNTFDNRKENLWKATSQENARNASLSKNNTSGFTGVTWRKKERQWMAYIMIDYKQKCLGYYTNKEDAIRTRLRAEKEYFGEFAPQRHLFEEYGII